MDLQERLRESQESRRRAWRVLEDVRATLEILGDCQIPREMKKRFLPEGERLVKALVHLLEGLRSRIKQLESGLRVAQSALARHGHGEDLEAVARHVMNVPEGHGLTQKELEERRQQLRDRQVLHEEPEPPHMG